LEYCFRDCGEPRAATAGRELESLRAKRKAADYDLADRRFVAIGTVDVEIKRARRIIEIIDQFRSGGPSDFRAKVRAHAKFLGLVVSDS
jgi:hypothetical protein